MLELLIFPLVVSSALLWKTRPKPEKKKQREMIEKLFEKVPLVVQERDKNGRSYLKRPKLEYEREYKWGTVLKYRLPIGVSYRMIAERVDLAMVIEDTINRDVEVDFDEFLIIRIFRHRLPTFVPFTTSMLERVKNNSYKVVIGVDHQSLVYHDFKIAPHMVIGGMTRYGKSVVLKLLITQLALTCDDVKFHLFDLKGGLAFNRFKRLPQTVSVSRDKKESLQNLKRVRNDIIQRQRYFEEKGYEDIGEAIANGEDFGRHLIIVDEASVLAPKDRSDQEGNQIRDILEFIAQVSGGMGYNLIMCSQYPTADILPRQVKQNSDAKLSFRLPTGYASNVILDEEGASNLPYGQRGRAIYKTDLKKMIQVPMITNEQIDEWLGPLRIDKEGEQHEIVDERRSDIIQFG